MHIKIVCFNFIVKYFTIYLPRIWNFSSWRVVKINDSMNNRKPESIQQANDHQAAKSLSTFITTYHNRLFVAYDSRKR